VQALTVIELKKLFKLHVCEIYNQNVGLCARARVFEGEGACVGCRCVCVNVCMYVCICILK
jgi:hypothetical protein